MSGAPVNVPEPRLDEPISFEQHKQYHWGYPFVFFSEEHQEQLRKLAERQDAWVASAPEGQRDLDQSAFRGVPLTGADVFWLAERVRDKRGWVHDLHLEQAILEGAHLSWAGLAGAHLEGANIMSATLDGALLTQAHLEHARAFYARLGRADLEAAHLEGADLAQTSLERAKLIAAHLEGADLTKAHLEGADLTRAYLDSATDLSHVILSDSGGRLVGLLRALQRRQVAGSVSLADVHWNGADVTGAEWSRLHTLGDELTKTWWWRSRDESERGARAYTQVARQLADAGLNDAADRFKYRAQVRQRGVYLLRLQVGRWLFSWMLAALAGYGYRLERILITYILTVIAFALVYLAIGVPGGFPHGTVPLADAFQLSFTAIHGRVSVEQVGLGSKLAWVTAAESIIGIVIEAVFTGVLIQRFFAR